MNNVSDDSDEIGRPDLDQENQEPQRQTSSPISDSTVKICAASELELPEATLFHPYANTLNPHIHPFFPHESGRHTIGSVISKCPAQIISTPDNFLKKPVPSEQAHKLNEEDGIAAFPSPLSTPIPGISPRACKSRTINPIPLHLTRKAKSRRVISRSMPDLRSNFTSQPTIWPRAADDMLYEHITHQVDSWDAITTLWTVANLSQKGGIRIQYHAQIAVHSAHHNVLADRVKLCLRILNCPAMYGHVEDRTYTLRPGEYTLPFNYEISTPLLGHHQTEITIIRDVIDLQAPLNIEISYSYPKSCNDTVVMLPIFRPAKGRVLSDSVVIAEPEASLIVTKLAKNEHTGWTSNDQPINRLLRFERTEKTNMFGQHLDEDILVKITKPLPVQYTFGGLHAAEVVWDLAIKVQRILGNELECRMILWLEVGDANTLLMLDPNGWQPKRFLVGGRLATGSGGEVCNYEGYLVLFKQNHMARGSIQIEMTWGKSNCLTSDCGRVLLPRMVDRAVSSGSIAGENIGFAFSSQPGGPEEQLVLDAQSELRLPDLYKGYQMLFYQVSEGRKSSVTCIEDMGSMGLNDRSFQNQTDNHRSASGGSASTKVGSESDTRRFEGDTTVNRDIEPTKPADDQVPLKVDPLPKPNYKPTDPPMFSGLSDLHCTKDAEGSTPHSTEERTAKYPSIRDLMNFIIAYVLILGGLYVFLEITHRRAVHAQTAGFSGDEIASLGGSNAASHLHQISGASATGHSANNGNHNGGADTWRDWMDRLLGWHGYGP